VSRGGRRAGGLLAQGPGGDALEILGGLAGWRGGEDRNEVPPCRSPADGYGDGGVDNQKKAREAENSAHETEKHLPRLAKLADSNEFSTEKRVADVKSEAIDVLLPAPSASRRILG
jgi:hypothetical protein